LRCVIDRREGFVEDGDVDAAFVQAIPVGQLQSDFLIVVEQGELHRLRHGVSWERMTIVGTIAAGGGL
jgi:hypothetical protein